MLAVSANVGPAEVTEGLVWAEDAEDDEEGRRSPVSRGSQCGVMRG